MPNSTAFAALIAVAATVAASSAAAYSDFYQTEAGSNFGSGAQDGFSESATTYTFPGVFFSVAPTPTPTIRGSASSPCCGGANGIGYFGYSFTVNGSDHISVPLLAHIVESGRVSANNVEGHALASSSLSILSPYDYLGDTVTVNNEAYVNQTYGSGASSYNVDEWVSFSEYSNDYNYVEGEAAAVTSAGEYYLDGQHLTVGASSASVYLDPYLEIDPTWSAANPGYMLYVSQPNALAAPEPGAWMLMLTGFGLVGAVVRRRASAIPA